MFLKDIQKKLHNFSQAGMLFLSLLLILVLVNVLSLRHFTRVDLTQERQYTISDISKQILARIDDVLTVKVYFSKDLPPNLRSVTQYVKDILEEYQAYTAQMRVEFIDPLSDPALQEEVEKLGIPQVQFNILKKDKFEIQNGYLGLAFFFEGRHEILPFVENTDNLEYQITSAIQKVGTQQTKTVAFLSGHSEVSLYDLPFGAEEGTPTYIAARRALEQNYDVRSISVKNGEEIVDVDTLIIGGPKEGLKERELFEIDQFVLKGGNAIFLVDPITLFLGIQAQANTTNLDRLLENLGVKLSAALVLDVSNETLTFQSGFMQFIVPYPFLVKTVKDFHSKEVPVVSKIESVVFPWVAPLELSLKEGVSGQILIQTTPKAWKMTAPYNLSPQQDFAPSVRAQYPLAIFLRGRFQSLFSGQTPPALDEGQESTDDPNGRVGISESVEESSVVVIGDSDFLSDRFIERYPDNLTFFLNLVDYLTLDETLIDIRAKTVSSRPIREISEGEKTKLRVLNILGVPFLVVALGIGRYVVRKRRK